MQLYLASASARRHQILNELNIKHQVLHVPSPEGEDEPILPGEHPKEYAKRTAHEKLQRALQWLGEKQSKTAAVLCADTCVAIDNSILGKPENNAQAAEFLQTLSNRSHWVFTAQALSFNGEIYQSLSSNEVVFRKLSPAEIKAYCATNEPFGKAGGYGIQGQASFFIKALRGRYSAVMGLDIYDLYQLLKQAGLHQLCFKST